MQVQKRELYDRALREIESILEADGPYIGKVGWLEIRFGQGVCGTAAVERRTVMVPDVTRFPGKSPAAFDQDGLERICARDARTPRWLRLHRDSISTMRRSSLRVLSSSSCSSAVSAGRL